MAKSTERKYREQKECLLWSLGTGRENAKSRAELSMELGISDRELRELIAELVKEGCLILSSSKSKGYYFPSDNKIQASIEVKEYCTETRSRIKKLKAKEQIARAYLSGKPFDVKDWREGYAE